MRSDTDPLVIQYFFVDERGGVRPPHPSVRTSSSVRYLECALTQTASLRLQDACCQIALATNIDPHSLSRAARALLARIEALDVEILRPEPQHEDPTPLGFLGQAILCACEGEPDDRTLWLPNLDCVWVSPERVFAATPSQDEIGCLFIAYPAEWHVGGSDTFASSRHAIGEIATGMGHPSNEAPPWVGADLLGGTPAALRELLNSCDRLSRHFALEGQQLAGEQLLGLVGALGHVHFNDLSHVAARIHTGRRHKSPVPPNAAALGLWHLPAEKGLSLRRPATAIRRGHANKLSKELTDPARMARRFNVTPTGLVRQLRDDSWLAAQRAIAGLRA